MDEMSLIQLLQNGLPFVESIVPSFIGTLLTTLFLRKDTSISEFEKIKANKFGEVIDSLIDSGKMTYKDLSECRNVMQIAEYADQHLKKDPTIAPDTERIYEYDWFIRFYEYAGKISNSDMQLLWGKLLAGELNNPGTVSYSLLHALYMMRREDAQIFENICRFVLCDINNQPHPFIFITKNRSIYAHRNITPSTLKKLERLGLIECDYANEYTFQHEDKFARYNQTKVRKIFRTGNKQVSVYGDPTKTNAIQAGNVVFTTDGEILYSIISESVKHYRGDVLEFIVDRLRNRGCQVTINDRSV